MGKVPRSGARHGDRMGSGKVNVTISKQFLACRALFFSYCDREMRPADALYLGFWEISFSNVLYFCREQISVNFDGSVYTGSQLS